MGGVESASPCTVFTLDDPTAQILMGLEGDEKLPMFPPDWNYPSLKRFQVSQGTFPHCSTASRTGKSQVASKLTDSCSLRRNSPGATYIRLELGYFYPRIDIFVPGRMVKMSVHL